MVVKLVIRELQTDDVADIVASFAAVCWNKPTSQYQRYLEEQANGVRSVLVAVADRKFAGYITILWDSHYEPFRSNSIPEVSDFNVLPGFRRKGIGTRLMDEAEMRIAKRSPLVGIGVGMGPDYGAAQRLYTKRGYVADGRGLMSHGKPVHKGQSVVVDDDLVLYFTRDLRS